MYKLDANAQTVFRALIGRTITKVHALDPIENEKMPGTSLMVFTQPLILDFEHEKLNVRYTNYEVEGGEMYFNYDLLWTEVFENNSSYRSYSFNGCIEKVETFGRVIPEDVEAMPSGEITEEIFLFHFSDYKQLYIAFSGCSPYIKIETDRQTIQLSLTGSNFDYQKVNEFT